MAKKAGMFLLFLIVAIYVVKHPGETVETLNYVRQQMFTFVDAL